MPDQPPPHLEAFAAGKHLVFARYCGAVSGWVKVFWSDELCCLVQPKPDRFQRDPSTVMLLVPQAMGGLREVSRIQGGSMDLLAYAASPAADGLAVVLEDPAGRRLMTTRGHEVVAERTYPGDSVGTFTMPDLLVTDGRCILTGEGGDRELRCFVDWELSRQVSFSLEPLGQALGDPRLHAGGSALRSGDTVLMLSGGWSRWSWDGRLLEVWRAPRSMFIAWHDAGPILIMRDPAPGANPHTMHVVVWDLDTAQARSLGATRSIPQAARSPDGRWLVFSRKTAAEENWLELWDLQSFTPVERIPLGKEESVRIVFSPSGAEVAVVWGEALFVLRLEP